MTVGGNYHGQCILSGSRKKYGDVEAVKGINLEIKDHEFVCLLGPSGCGKSSTLRMIAGLEDVSGGEIYIGSRLVNDLWPKERDIAMVFENYALYPHLTAYENMAFPLESRKLPKEKIREAITNAAKILDIQDLLNRMPAELSGGQKQRVAIGRAIVREPAVFLMDEPISHLDAKLRDQMRGELKRLQKQLGATTIYVSHDQIEAMTMADRIAVMNLGELQQVAAPQEVFRKLPTCLWLFSSEVPRSTSSKPSWQRKTRDIDLFGRTATHSGFRTGSNKLCRGSATPEISRLHTAAKHIRCASAR